MPFLLFVKCVKDPAKLPSKKNIYLGLCPHVQLTEEYLPSRTNLFSMTRVLAIMPPSFIPFQDPLSLHFIAYIQAHVLLANDLILNNLLQVDDWHLVS